MSTQNSRNPLQTAPTNRGILYPLVINPSTLISTSQKRGASWVSASRMIFRAIVNEACHCMLLYYRSTSMWRERFPAFVSWQLFPCIFCQRACHFRRIRDICCRFLAVAMACVTLAKSRCYHCLHLTGKALHNFWFSVCPSLPAGLRLAEIDEYVTENISISLKKNRLLWTYQSGDFQPVSCTWSTEALNMTVYNLGASHPNHPLGQAAWPMEK